MDANDFSQLVLKPDHEHRPIWTCSSSSNEHTIYLDPSHDLFAKPAYEFLNAVAEPVSRPHEGLHQYRLTEYSLYAAAVADITEYKIVTYLDRFSKNNLQDATKAFIRNCAQKFGKGRLVLKGGKYHVESKSPEILKILLRDPDIAEARDTDTIEEVPSPTHLIHKNGAMHCDDSDDDETETETEEEEEDEDEDEINWFSFPIKKNTAALVKRQARELGYPLLEE